ncbi:hypothetical protein Peetri_00083 [Pseudomonas phage vB_PpuM-Peetri]
MKANLAKVKSIMLTQLVLVLIISGYYMFTVGQHRDEKVMRYALMVDTSADSSYHKSNYSYNTSGYYVDEETKLYFRDDISDKLYRQFEAGGNKPIRMSWPYSIDKREQTSIGFFYIMGGVMLEAIAIILLIHLVMKAWARHVREQKPNVD